jgi:hypothetical protein
LRLENELTDWERRLNARMAVGVKNCMIDDGILGDVKKLGKRYREKEVEAWCCGSLNYD